MQSEITEYEALGISYTRLRNFEQSKITFDQPLMTLTELYREANALVEGLNIPGYHIDVYWNRGSNGQFIWLDFTDRKYPLNNMVFLPPDFNPIKAFRAAKDKLDFVRRLYRDWRPQSSDPVERDALSFIWLDFEYFSGNFDCTIRQMVEAGRGEEVVRWCVPESLLS